MTNELIFEIGVVIYVASLVLGVVCLAVRGVRAQKAAREENERARKEHEYNRREQKLNWEDPTRNRCGVEGLFTLSCSYPVGHSEMHADDSQRCNWPRSRYGNKNRCGGYRLHHLLTDQATCSAQTPGVSTPFKES